MGARSLAVGLWLAVAPLWGQEVTTKRMLCDPEKTTNRCPGPECACSDDVLEVIFDETGDSVLRIDEPSMGIAVHMTVVIDVKSPEIQGWSYGVAHDKNRILIESVAFDGTDAAEHFRSGFQITTMDNIETCLPMDAKCARTEPGGGYISACVLALSEPVHLPLMPNSLSRARYSILEDSGSDEVPIVLSLSERLKRRGSPPVSINMTNRGRAIQPQIVSDGWIVSEASRPFRRGDPDGDGRPSVADSISLLLFLFLSGPSPGCLEAADFDDDGRIDGTDPISILRWLFLQGPPPGPNGFQCDRDPDGSTADLGCSAYETC